MLTSRRTILESLESRRLLSISAVPSDGISSTFNHGTLKISTFGTNETALLTVSGGQTLIVDLNGNQQNFPLSGTTAVTKVILPMSAGTDSVNIGFGVPAVAIRGSGATETITAANNANNTLRGGAGADSISDSGDGNNLIEGGAGADTLIAGNGADTLIGNGGDDSLVGGYGNSLLSAGDGNDTVISGSGNSTLQCGDGMDSLNGSGTGYDLISVGSGADTIVGATGGPGIDTITGITARDSITPGFEDVIPPIPSLAPTITKHGEVVQIVGTSGDDTCSLSTSLNPTSGISLDITIDQLTNDNAAISGLGQIDIKRVKVYLGAGNDSLSVASGVPKVFASGGGGNDTLAASNTAADTLVGGAGNDSLLGNGAAGESISGGAGNDSVIPGN
jgi:Ca2+-binding RTX toxin-like protein